MNSAGRFVEQSISFDEYKAARISGRFDDQATKEDVLMALFGEKGIDMVNENGLKPTPPAEVITDLIGQKFVIQQIQK